MDFGRRISGGRGVQSGSVRGAFALLAAFYLSGDDTGSKNHFEPVHARSHGILPPFALQIVPEESRHPFRLPPDLTRPTFPRPTFSPQSVSPSTIFTLPTYTRQPARPQTRPVPSGRALFVRRLRGALLPLRPLPRPPVPNDRQRQPDPTKAP